MFKFRITFLVSLFIWEQVIGQCYKCQHPVRDPNSYTECGSFDEHTLREVCKDTTSQCMKTHDYLRKVTTYECDDDYCRENKLSNRCTTVAENTTAGMSKRFICCCEDYYCNSGSILSSSVLVLFLPLLSYWIIGRSLLI